MMHNFKAFDNQCRVNKFKAEDYYFLRNQITHEQPKAKKTDQEVIHVMIDYASLSNLSSAKKVTNQSINDETVVLPLL